MGSRRVKAGRDMWEEKREESCKQSCMEKKGNVSEGMAVQSVGAMKEISEDLKHSRK